MCDGTTHAFVDAVQTHSLNLKHDLPVPNDRMDAIKALTALYMYQLTVQASAPTVAPYSATMIVEHKHDTLPMTQLEHPDMRHVLQLMLWSRMNLSQLFTHAMTK